MLNKTTTLATFLVLLLGIPQREASMSSIWIPNSIASSTQTTFGTACRGENLTFASLRIFAFQGWKWEGRFLVQLNSGIDFGSD
jgi:hypothetical protein